MSRASGQRIAPAQVFAALGSATRLELLSRISDGKYYSIADLTDGLSVTRQAITKHLRVLQIAGIVSRQRIGRESRFAVEPAAVIQASEYLARISDQWDRSIGRLRAQVESL